MRWRNRSQTKGFEFGRLQDNVLFIDNGVNLDSSTLPIPDPTPPL